MIRTVTNSRVRSSRVVSAVGSHMAVDSRADSPVVDGVVGSSTSSSSGVGVGVVRLVVKCSRLSVLLLKRLFRLSSEMMIVPFDRGKGSYWAWLMDRS